MMEMTFLYRQRDNETAEKKENDMIGVGLGDLLWCQNVKKRE